MIHYLFSLILVFSFSFGFSVIESQSIIAQEESDVQEENQANQDFSTLHDETILATAATEGTVSADINLDKLAYDELIEYNEGNQKMWSLLYDDETTEIILYFIDDSLTYLGWTNYEPKSNPIGEGYISDTNELKATIKKIENDNHQQLEIDAGDKKEHFDYHTELINSQRHAFELLIEAADLEIDIAIDSSETPVENLTESREESMEESIEEASLNYKELVENPAWLVEETNQAPSILIEAYERIKSGDESKLEEPDESDTNRDIYLGNNEDLFVKLEITKNEPFLVTLNHYTPDIYQSFPADFDVNKTYTAEELVNVLGPVTIKQFDLEHSTERLAWIRLANDEMPSVLNAYPDLESDGKYIIEFSEIEE